MSKSWSFLLQLMMLSKKPIWRNIYKSICKPQQYQTIPLYIHKASVKKYIENKCGSLGSAQIPTRHGTHMRRHHQVNGHKCTNLHKVELLIRFMLTKDRMRWLAWPRSKRVGESLSKMNPNLWKHILSKKSINKQEMEVLM